MIKKVESPMGTTNYENYKSVKGVMIPYSIETSNQQGVMTSVVAAIKTNVKVNYEKNAHP